MNRHIGRQEDYLKAIYNISRENKGGWVVNSEIAKLLDVTPATVTGMLYKLQDQGLISWKPRNSIRLTKKGKKQAKTLIIKYQMLKVFFIKVLKIKDSKKVDDMCCKIEHLLTNEASVAINNFVLDLE